MEVREHVQARTHPVLRLRLHYRQIFISGSVLNGLSRHIALIRAGHRDINGIVGHKAVYRDEAVQAWPFSPAGAPCAPPTNTAYPPTRNGSNSSATSNDAHGTCGKSLQHALHS